MDAYWDLCMAINVYLIFFRNYSITRLRALDHKYLIVCYGASFVPSVVYLFISSPGRGKVYGNALVS